MILDSEMSIDKFRNCFRELQQLMKFEKAHNFGSQISGSVALKSFKTEMCKLSKGSNTSMQQDLEDFEFQITVFENVNRFSQI